MRTSSLANGRKCPPCATRLTAPLAPWRDLPFAFGPNLIDSPGGLAWGTQGVILLTPTESKIVRHLLSGANFARTQAELFSCLSSHRSAGALDKHLQNIRAKLARVGSGATISPWYEREEPGGVALLCALVRA